MMMKLVTMMSLEDKKYASFLSLSVIVCVHVCDGNRWKSDEADEKADEVSMATTTAAC